jgi:uncharacterized protein YkvS
MFTKTMENFADVDIDSSGVILQGTGMNLRAPPS